MPGLGPAASSGACGIDVRSNQSSGRPNFGRRGTPTPDLAPCFRLELAPPDIPKHWSSSAATLGIFVRLPRRRTFSASASMASCVVSSRGQEMSAPSPLHPADAAPGRSSFPTAPAPLRRRSNAAPTLLPAPLARCSGAARAPLGGPLEHRWGRRSDVAPPPLGRRSGDGRCSRAGAMSLRHRPGAAMMLLGRRSGGPPAPAFASIFIRVYRSPRSRSHRCSSSSWHPAHQDGESSELCALLMPELPSDLRYCLAARAGRPADRPPITILQSCPIPWRLGVLGGSSLDLFIVTSGLVSSDTPGSPLHGRGLADRSLSPSGCAGQVACRSWPVMRPTPSPQHSRRSRRALPSQAMLLQGRGLFTSGACCYQEIYAITCTRELPAARPPARARQHHKLPVVQTSLVSQHRLRI